jgi:phosphatidylethanolamine/phosphatidyl-N-methylethanolamine N-methyltransferase
MATAEVRDSGKDRGYWERHAQRYDRSLTLLSRPMPRMLELTAEAVRGAASVLEVAAGTGLVTAALGLAAQQVVATDYASAMIDILKVRVREAGLTNVICEQADLYALRFQTASFDAVVAANVLHLVPDLDGAIASLRRVLRPGGRLVVPTFCHDETRTSAAVSRLLSVTGFPGQRRFTSSSLSRSLEGAGLRVSKREVIAGLIPIIFLEGRFDSADA